MKLFRDSIRKRDTRDVDRLLTLREEGDRVAWARIAEISQELMRHGDRMVALRAAELNEIAMDHLSFIGHLGIREETPLMASGDSHSKDFGSIEEDDSLDINLEEPASAAVRELKRELEMARRREELRTSDQDGAQDDADALDEGDSLVASHEEEAKVDAEDGVEDVAANVTGEEDTLPQARACFVRNPGFADDATTLDDLELAYDAIDLREVKVAASSKSAVLANDDLVQEMKQDLARLFEPYHPVDTAVNAACDTIAGNERYSELDSGCEAMRNAAQEESLDDAEAQAFAAQRVATFRHVTESRDGKLCLFEDADGHLVVVKADRLV